MGISMFIQQKMTPVMGDPRQAKDGSCRSGSVRRRRRASRYNDSMDPEVSCCAWTVMVGQWSGWGSQVETLVGRTRRALAVPGQRYEEG
jgi:hypothetical protein